MGKWRIGILVDNLGLGIGPGIEKAAELGADGVQVYCTSGEMSPRRMTKSGRRAFVARLEALGLALSALCGDTFKGFFDSKTIDEQVVDAKAFVDLARDLGTTVVTTHFGHFPKSEEDPAWRMAVDALRTIGEHAEDRGVSYASETGLESPRDLAAFLERVGSRAIRVNYDPANLCFRGFDHIAGVKILKDYIVHTHAKDYKKGGEETPLGMGDVDYPKYLSALEEAGYKGFVTIERESGEDVVGDVTEALAYLRKF